VSDAAARSFEKAHPRCEVINRWDLKLHKAVAGADRLRVRSGGPHLPPSEVLTFFVENDAGRIRGIAAMIKIDEQGSNFHCMCDGTPSIEFYRGEALILTLGLHHGRSLRWSEGWPGDGLLAPESAGLFVKWLASRGVRGPLDERNKTK
jgi:hypothetical protein